MSRESDAVAVTRGAFEKALEVLERVDEVAQEDREALLGHLSEARSALLMAETLVPPEPRALPVEPGLYADKDGDVWTLRGGEWAFLSPVFGALQPQTGSTAADYAPFRPLDEAVREKRASRTAPAGAYVDRFGGLWAFHDGVFRHLAHSSGARPGMPAHAVLNAPFTHAVSGRVYPAECFEQE